MMMRLIVLTSLPAADCSTFLLLRREKLDHQWFEAGSVVQPVPMSTMNVGVVGVYECVDLLTSYFMTILRDTIGTKIVKKENLKNYCYY